MATIKFRALFAFFATVVISNISFAAQIACDIDVSNVQAQLAIKPNNDVYVFSKIDLQGGFRVSGQYLPILSKFKLYVYDSSKERYKLLINQEFALSPDICSRDFGQNRIYGEPYERELYVHCRQVCTD